MDYLILSMIAVVAIIPLVNLGYAIDTNVKVNNKEDVMPSTARLVFLVITLVIILVTMGVASKGNLGKAGLAMFLWSLSQIPPTITIDSLVAAPLPLNIVSLVAHVSAVAYAGYKYYDLVN